MAAMNKKEENDKMDYYGHMLHSWRKHIKQEIIGKKLNKKSLIAALQKYCSPLLRKVSSTQHELIIKANAVIKLLAIACWYFDCGIGFGLLGEWFELKTFNNFKTYLHLLSHAIIHDFKKCVHIYLDKKELKNETFKNVLSIANDCDVCTIFFIFVFIYLHLFILNNNIEFNLS